VWASEEPFYISFTILTPVFLLSNDSYVRDVKGVLQLRDDDNELMMMMIKPSRALV